MTNDASTSLLTLTRQDLALRFSAASRKGTNVIDAGIGVSVTKQSSCRPSKGDAACC
jgi:hypothetical protein